MICPFKKTFAPQTNAIKVSHSIWNVNRKNANSGTRSQGGFVSPIFSSDSHLQAKTKILSILSKTYLKLHAPFLSLREETQGTPLRKTRHSARRDRHNPLHRQPKRPHDTHDKPGDKPSQEPPRTIVGGGARRLQNKKLPFPVLPRPGPGRLSLPSLLPPPPEAGVSLSRLQCAARQRRKAEVSEADAPPSRLQCAARSRREAGTPEASSPSSRPGHSGCLTGFSGSQCRVRGGAEAAAPPSSLCSSRSLGLLPLSAPPLRYRSYLITRQVHWTPVGKRAWLAMFF